MGAERACKAGDPLSRHNARAGGEFAGRGAGCGPGQQKRTGCLCSRRAERLCVRIGCSERRVGDGQSTSCSLAGEGGRALLSTRLSPGFFAAAAMRKVQKDLVAMKVVEQGGAGRAWRGPLGQQGVAAPPAARRYSERGFGDRAAGAAGEQNVQNFRARLRRATFTILPRAGPLLSFCPKSTPGLLAF